MKLPPEGAHWLISLRWLACVSVLAVIWLTSSVLRILPDPLPLYAVASALAGYNVLFWWTQRGWERTERNTERNAERSIFLQVALDLVALTLLLYFSDLPRNPFLFFFVFHMIIASMYLPGRIAYLAAAMATALVGSVLLLESLDWIPGFPLRFSTKWRPHDDATHMIGLFVAFASTLWITVYFTTSIRRYVDRAHAEIRQKEKILGIGQLVAGIAHQIANPLDGVQNCLRRIGEKVKDDKHLTEYIHLMTDALQRIERTAKRVQAFARPRGISLQNTDVNAAVDATLKVLGTSHGADIQIEAELGEIPLVLGDPYTLQEVLFNLCANALAAMPDGGMLRLSTRALGRKDEGQQGAVAVEVSDTGVGIPRSQFDKIFEPFFTTRGESGGTGLGLGLCRMLISEMGGQIDVRSELGEGTTFTVVLHPTDVETTTMKSEI